MRARIGHHVDLTALSRSVDVGWISQALAATGKASVRRRKLPAEQVVWLVIALALYRHQSIADVAAHLSLALPDEVNPDIARSALTQARQRLGQAPLAQLFAICAACWDERHQNGRAWRGLTRYAVDGSTLRTSDSEENRAHFGAQSNTSGVVASYPQLRLLTLTALATHLVRDAVFGAYDTNEMLYAKSLVGQVPDHSLTVFDKGFFSASLLLRLQTQGTQRHWLIPAKANCVWERLDQTPGDYRVRRKVSPQARQAEPGLPASWEARAIETTTRHGKKRILLTSLMDTKAYPAKDIVHQYEERWRIETSYRELKQELLGSELTLRSGTPETVCQEVWGALLAYNLVRLEMAEIAVEAEVPPTQLSFTATLHYLRQEWGWMAIEAPGKIPAHLVRLRNRRGDLLLSTKRGRSCPRVVKTLPRKYDQRTVSALK
ncbi:IS4 family transposase [Asticcacaulis sp.]|uniref:IS4 family transposase n=1 Tax=Asticcacaulis sp. TaxID=1872648 RepID=UPI0031D50D0B